MTAPRARLAALALALSALALPSQAQTLPPSTVDRQAIAQLQYQLTQPGVSPSQRREIQLQISQLEYQINTRSPIAPAGSSPAPFTIPALEQRAPLSPLQLVPYEPVHYGSCEADRSVIAYLRGELGEPGLSQQERSYIPQQIDRLRDDLRARNC
ncbi:MAG TPA: hypothetical protein VGN11_04190 [Candidatus Baltobacteraceae bacterium]|jgi:hypothetical protein|nr:hypothetical protein [Candidatus Baltobacteraceae bacterium]